MSLLWIYIKDKKKVILYFLLCAVICIVSFWLFHLPMLALWYPLVICGAAGLIMGSIDFYGFRRHSLEMDRLKNGYSELPEDLPEALSSIEASYRNIVLNLKNEYSELKESDRQKYTDMIDYYTTWAHQIKTPIAAMRLKLQSEDTEFSRSVRQELFRIESYVDMVLTYLRLGSESTDYMFKEYDLDQIIRQCLKKFASEFIGRKLQLNYEPVEKKVLTDEKWLSFVLEQILSNALKYTEKGSITIYMEDFVLCIADTGFGIRSEDLPRIFEKGYTGFNGRMDHKASGIGLYLCKMICTRLGHSISAESVLSEGTTIRIDLSRRQLLHE